MTYAYGERGDEEANIVNGLLTSQTYGNGDKVSFTYDDLGRNKTTTYSDGRVLTYAYTGDGQLYSIHDSKTQYTYVYTYDSIGRLIASCVKSGGTVLMQTRQEYDANNQMTAQHWTVGDTTYSQTFTYNKQEGMVTAMTTGNGHSIQLEYDALRRISKVDTTTLDRFYEYADGKGSNQTTGTVARYWYRTANYDDAYFKYSYAYDELGNITSYSQHGTAYTYTYDDQNQLLSQTGGGKTYSYTYDNAGNITSATSGSTTHTYSYNNGVWRDLLTSYDGQRILYEGERLNGSAVEGKPTSGNPISYYNGTRWEFDWEEGRNLVSATSGSNTYAYAYDSNGLRVSKEENGKTHTYLYASGKLLRETISVGNTVTDTLDFFYDHNGYPYSVKHNGTNYYYITNLQGDVLAMITGQGGVVASYSYDPYGKPLDTPDEDTIEELNPLRYRGYYYDAEIGFYYLQSRYYDPVVCRYLNRDVVFDYDVGIIGYNLFAYCGNCPIFRIDVSGKDSDGIEDCDELDDYEMKVKGGGGGNSSAPTSPSSSPSTSTSSALSNGTSTGAQSSNGNTTIYRYGGTNPANLTPKGKDANSGLSFSTVPKSGAAVTTIEDVNSTGILQAVQDGLTHVSITPTNASMWEWIAAGVDSIWTKILRSIVSK